MTSQNDQQNESWQVKSVIRPDIVRWPAIIFSPDFIASVQRKSRCYSAIGLVIFVLNLPDGQVLFFGKFKLQRDCNQSC